MTRTVARSLVVVVSALTVGCAVQSGESAGGTGVAGSGGISITGTGAMCGNNQGRPTFGGGIAGSVGSPTTPQLGATHTSTNPPPAISGGTLRILKDGHTAVAADPDRDRVYIVDLTKRSVTATVMLQPGDEPGRVVSDAAGRVHVALRRGGALVTIAPATGEILDRRDVCAAPRGVAYDAATDLLHVACADGQLVSLPAAGGVATRTLHLDADLRDVVVDGPRLRVSRFKSAELLTIEGDAKGTLLHRVVPPAFRSVNTRNGQLFTASVAWRAVEMPAGGVAILHQRGVEDAVDPAVGGYGGGFSTCDAIVQTAVTTVAPDQSQEMPVVKTGPSMNGLVLAVDMAISPTGKVAIVAPGNSTNSETEGGTPRLPRVFVTDMNSATDSVIGCANDGQHAPCLPLGMGGFFPGGATTGAAGASGTSDIPQGATAPASDGGVSVDPTSPAPSSSPFPTSCGTLDGSQPTDPTVPQVVGQPIAVAFDGSGSVVVQSREPALLELPGGAPITLSTESRSDTGHTIFHANAGGFIACASCHAEGNEDGRIWTFACEGARRTQSLQVGLKGTEPFHWGGDEKDFTQLVQDVFVGRMSGPQLQPEQVTATLDWIDAQPRRTKTMPTDTAAVARGRALFIDPAHAGCATCHAGPSLTNNQSVDVGTGGMFQVPSLVGISTRGPYMHNGCAETLRDRFGACGGGDKHGVTSKLTSGQIDDLVMFLQTL